MSKGKPVTLYFDTIQMIYAHLIHNDPFLPMFYHESDESMGDWDGVYLVFDSYKDVATFFGFSSSYISTIIREHAYRWEMGNKKVNVLGSIGTICGVPYTMGDEKTFDKTNIKKARTLYYSMWLLEKERGAREISDCTIKSLWKYNLKKYERSKLYVENGVPEFAKRI